MSLDRIRNIVQMSQYKLWCDNDDVSLLFHINTEIPSFQQLPKIPFNFAKIIPKTWGSNRVGWGFVSVKFY